MQLLDFMVLSKTKDNYSEIKFNNKNQVDACRIMLGG
jgi:hypothetical protein